MLDFTLFELVSILLELLIIDCISRDGIINWLEGVMVTVGYVIILLFYYCCRILLPSYLG